MDVVLKRGREASLLGRHPWVFSGAIRTITAEPASGETVNVLSDRGEWLARGAFSPQSQIRVRAWTFDPDEQVDAAFFQRRLANALELRKRLAMVWPTRAFRLCNAESDGLPGVVIDRYGPWFAGQFLSAGAERWKAEIADAALKVLPGSGFYERSDVEVRTKEGLPQATGVLAGKEPPELFEIDDNGPRMLVDIRRGHKTGMYLDQASNRREVRRLVQMSRGDVLNAFCYTGGFGLHAAAGQANRIVQLDQSADALEVAQENATLNEYINEFEYIQGNAFDELRRLREAGRNFDVVILDPPKFAAGAAQLERAAGAYKDINLLGAQLTKPGGWLLTFSCSGHMTPSLFSQVVADALVDAGRDGQVVQPLTQSPDHPVSIHYPEGHYLKGLLLRV
ncbi:MAG: class I SAM-dependent methyltransferase [Planctomycetes bacterium]|nr:class I SAM-dependent methyltransferase [Planctomycetota bacterium]